MNHSSQHFTGGLFIVFEGIDGTGKSTQCQLLAEALQKSGWIVHLDKEPSDLHYGAILRQSANSGRLSAEQELEYFHLDRKMHVKELISPAKARGEIVILDRYYFSTVAYQGQRGFDPDELLKENEGFAPKPDILFILDLAVEDSLKRIGKRGTVTEFETSESLEYCRQTYLKFANEPYAKVISSLQSVESIHEEVLQHLGTRFPSLRIKE